MAKIKSTGDIQKCYNIKITGKVQDIGFRMLIEDIARFHDLKGYAFNDVDESVKMVCCGGTGVIDEFLDELRYRGIQKGVAIDEIAKKEITSEVYLPQRFLRLYTDELADIGRKLDKGNEFLKNLPDMKNGIENLNVKFDSFITVQTDHNKRLEKILEKLAEK